MLSSLLTRRNCMEFSKACQVVHPKRGPAVLLRSSDRTAPPIVVTGLAPYLAVRVSPTAPRAAVEALPQALNSVLAGRFHFASSEDPESSAIEWCFMEKSEDEKYPKLIRDWTIIGDSELRMFFAHPQHVHWAAQKLSDPFGALGKNKAGWLDLELASSLFGVPRSDIVAARDSRDEDQLGRWQLCAIGTTRYADQVTGRLGLVPGSTISFSDALEGAHYTDDPRELRVRWCNVRATAAPLPKRAASKAKVQPAAKKAKAATSEAPPMRGNERRISFKRGLSGATIWLGAGCAWATGTKDALSALSGFVEARVRVDEKVFAGAYASEGVSYESAATLLRGFSFLG